MKRKKKGKSEDDGYSVEGADRILPDEGLHVARPIRVIEMGSQETEWGDKFKVSVSYELTESSAVFNPDKGEQNFVVHRKYNKSLHKRSDLGKDVRAIMGKRFPTKGRFEMDNILDEPCMVEIEHSEDGQYANIVKVSAAVKGGKPIKVAKSENECISLYLDDNFDEDVFDGLHDSVQAAIEKSPEYQEMFPDAKPKRKGKNADEDEDEDDEPKKGRRAPKKAVKKKRSRG